MPTVFDSRDADAIHSYLSSTYASLRLGPMADPHVRVDATSLGATQLQRVQLHAGLRADVEPLGRVVIGTVRGGTLENTWAGGSIGGAAGDVVIPVQPDAPFRSSTCDLDVDVTILEPGALDAVAHNAPGDPGPVRLLDLRPVSPAAAQRWRQLHAFLAQVAAGPDAVTPLVAHQLDGLVASTVLTVFPTTAQIEPTAADRHDAHPPTLRRAISFIEAHSDLDLTVVDIAAAAYVTPRALQLAFRRHLDTTPMAYVRAVRLDRAHADLLAAADGATVTTVAAKWGFDVSRFARQYRAAYGCSPHQTMQS